MKEGSVVCYFLVIFIFWAVSADALNGKDISVAHGQMSLHGKYFKAREILGDKLDEAQSKKEIMFFPEGYEDKSKSIKSRRTEIWVHQSDYRHPTTHPVTPSP